MLSDDTESATLDRVEELYEATIQLSEYLMAEAEGVDHFNLAGVEVKLKSGESVMASVDSNILARILSVLDFDELAKFTDAITHAVEEPDYRPICKR